MIQTLSENGWVGPESADQSNTYTGGKGNDSFESYSSADTYVFNRGDGNDTISDEDYRSAGTQDTIRFGAGIAAADVSASRSGNDLILTIANPANPATPDSITIRNWSDADYRIEQIQFADGTAWTADDLDAGTQTATAAPDAELVISAYTGPVQTATAVMPAAMSAPIGAAVMAQANLLSGFSAPLAAPLQSPQKSIENQAMRLVSPRTGAEISLAVQKNQALPAEGKLPTQAILLPASAQKSPENQVPRFVTPQQLSVQSPAAIHEGAIGAIGAIGAPAAVQASHALPEGQTLSAWSQMNGLLDVHLAVGEGARLGDDAALGEGLVSGLIAPIMALQASPFNRNPQAAPGSANRANQYHP